MKSAGLLNPSTDPAQLADRAWLSLDGVTDQWVQELKVEHVAETKREPRGDSKIYARLMAALLAGQIQNCCDDFCSVK
jgi:hypothetical protein